MFEALVFLKQAIASFFSHVMTAIGGNSAGAGPYTYTFCYLLVGIKMHILVYIHIGLSVFPIQNFLTCR